MPAWFVPFATASLAVLLVNVALLVQRARERSKAWPVQFLRELQRWDGRLPHTADGDQNSSRFPSGS